MLCVRAMNQPGPRGNCVFPGAGAQRGWAGGWLGRSCPRRAGRSSHPLPQLQAQQERSGKGKEILETPRKGISGAFRAALRLEAGLGLLVLFLKGVCLTCSEKSQWWARYNPQPCPHSQVQYYFAIYFAPPIFQWSCRSVLCILPSPDWVLSALSLSPLGSWQQCDISVDPWDPLWPRGLQFRACHWGATSSSWKGSLQTFMTVSVQLLIE